MSKKDSMHCMSRCFFLPACSPNILEVEKVQPNSCAQWLERKVASQRKQPPDEQLSILHHTTLLVAPRIRYCPR
jgi:hypothetical protein